MQNVRTFVRGKRGATCDGEVVTLEGLQETNRVVVVEFPSLEAAQKFCDSGLYAAAKKKSAKGQPRGSLLLWMGFEVNRSSLL